MGICIYSCTVVHFKSSEVNSLSALIHVSVWKRKGFPRMPRMIFYFLILFFLWHTHFQNIQRDQRICRQLYLLHKQNRLQLRLWASTFFFTPFLLITFSLRVWKRNENIYDISWAFIVKYGFVLMRWLRTDYRLFMGAGAREGHVGLLNTCVMTRMMIRIIVFFNLTRFSAKISKFLFLNYFLIILIFNFTSQFLVFYTKLAEVLTK